MLRASSRDALSTKFLCTSDAALYLVDVSNLHQKQLMNNGPEALDRLIELFLEQDSCNDVTNSYAMKVTRAGMDLLAAGSPARPRVGSWDPPSA